MRLAMTWGVVPFLLAAAGSCRDQGPEAASPASYVVRVSLGDTVWADIDPSDGAVGPGTAIGGRLEGSVLSPDRSALYQGVKRPDFSRTLGRIDTRTGEEMWELPLARSNGLPTVTNGIGLISGEVLAVSPDGSRIYAWRASRDGATGIVAIDAATRTPTAFSGPWNVAAGGIVPLAGSASQPAGTLAVLASRASGGPRVDEALYLLDPATLAVSDSLTAAQLFGEGESLVHMAGAGQRLYLLGNHHLARLDAATREVIATATVPVSGSIFLSADGGTLFLVDGRSIFDTPGSGLLRLYSPDLTSLGTIDVSTPLGGQPDSPTATVMGTGATSPDGGVLYLRTGTPEIGPLFPVQPARLVMIDLASRSVVRVIPLGGYGVGAIHVYR